jgi:ubiquinone/menaquinone biosynthesis C-methylase UbiE
MSRDVNPMPGSCKFSDLITIELRNYFGEFDSIIELGCGRGGNLTKYPEVKTLVGIDPNPINIKKAQKVVKNGQIILGDHTLLSKFDNNQFDVGFTCSVLDHMEDFIPALNDLCRVCKNIMLLEPTIKGPTRQAKKSETSCWKISWYHDYVAWLKMKGLDFRSLYFPMYKTDSGKLFWQFIIYSEKYIG